MNETQNKTKISVKKLREIFKLLPYPIYIWKKAEDDFILIDYNTTIENITEGKIRSFIGIKASIFYKGQPEFLEVLNRCVDEKTKISREMMYSLKPTEIDKSLNVSYQFISPDLVMVLTEDITKRKRAEQELKESEERLRIILEKADIAFALLDLEGKMIMVNDSALKMTGYTREEFLRMNAAEVALEIIPMKHRKEYWEKLAVGEHVEVMGTHKRKDGSIFPAEITLIKINLKDQPIIAVFVRDISKHRETLQELKISEEMHRLISESVNDMIFINDAKGKYIYCNDAIKRILGYIPDELIGISALDLVHPEDKNNLYKAFKDVILSRVMRTEARIRCKDGSYKWVEYIGRGVYDENNNLTKMIGIGRDITTQKNALEKLKESEEKYRSLSEQSFMGITIAQDNKIKYMNETYSKIFGYTIPEMSQWTIKDLKEVIHPDDFNFILNQFLKKQRGDPDAIKNYQYRAFKKSGEMVWIDNYSKPIIYEGKAADFITVIDITDRKKAEEALKKSEEKYREAYDRSDLYKDIFTHDINNILQNTLSSFELSKLFSSDPTKTEKIKEISNLISEQVIRGKKLISNIQLLAEAEEIKAPLSSIEALMVINNAIESVKGSFPHKSLNIQIESFQKQYFVIANDLLINIFENVLFNAIKHNVSVRIEILIKISREIRNGLNFIKFEFLDNGVGIPNSMKKEIFSRDYRKYKKDKVPSGIGLGLLLVKRIVDSLNGTIEVEDKIKGDYSKGSNFIILLPETLKKDN